MNSLESLCSMCCENAKIGMDGSDLFWSACRGRFAVQTDYVETAIKAMDEGFQRCACTFSSISLCYHGEPVHRSTRQLHVIRVDPAVMTCQHTLFL